MAVIHVGILKAILDLGPSGLAYYNWCLGFVITALALQFISGIIAIYIATMKSFLSQFKYDIGYYLKRTCCPCIVKSYSKSYIQYSVGTNEANIGEVSTLVRDGESHQETGCCLCCKASEGNYIYLQLC